MADDEAEEDENISIGVSRYPCMPSLVALQQMRNRLHLAHLGRKLMKWTSLATSKELRRIGHEYIIATKNYGENIRDAYILLARCRYFYPNLNTMVTEDVLRYPKEAIVTVQTSYKYVTGITECRLEIYRSDDPPYLHLGVDKGGELIMEAKRVWFELLRAMILILELQMDFEMAEASHKGATKKANVLSKIIIPKITKSIHYILSELEEKEREEIFRLKRVKQKKEKLKARMLAELRGRHAIQEEPFSIYELLPKQSTHAIRILGTELTTEKDTDSEGEPIKKLSCNCLCRKKPNVATKIIQTVSSEKPSSGSISQKTNKDGSSKHKGRFKIEKPCEKMPCQYPSREQADFATKSIQTVSPKKRSSESDVQKTKKDDSHKQTQLCEIEKEIAILEHEATILEGGADKDDDTERCPICRSCAPDQTSVRSVYFDAVDMISDNEDYDNRPVRVAMKGTGSKFSRYVRFGNQRTQTCDGRSGSPCQDISLSFFKRYLRANKFKSSVYPSDSLKSCHSGSQPPFVRVPVEKAVIRTKSLPLRRTKSVGRTKSSQIKRTNSASKSSCNPECAGRISDYNISRKRVRKNKKTQATCDTDCSKVRMIDAACDTVNDDFRICDSCEPCMVHNYDEINEIRD